MSINVLLTGAGGNLAHFIHRALLLSKMDLRIVACDYSHNAVGLYLADKGYVVPPAKDSKYLPTIIEICKREKIHIILVGGMIEMRILAENTTVLRNETPAFVVTSPPKILRRAEDKWELARHLAHNGFDSPRSVLPSDRAGLCSFMDEIVFPYVVKDRFGGGSQGIAVARNKKQLEYLVETIPNPVVQEYLYPDDEEYTIGVFVSSNGKSAACIVMKRQLRLGMTFKSQVLPESELGSFCEKIVESVGCIGPANVQLRLTNRGPVVFEINPRFSSTTSARPYYGYNEAEMCIRHFVLKEEIDRPVIQRGRFFRVIEDVFVGEEIFEFVRREGRIENKRESC